MFNKNRKQKVFNSQDSALKYLKDNRYRSYESFSHTKQSYTESIEVRLVDELYSKQKTEIIMIMLDLFLYINKQNILLRNYNGRKEIRYLLGR